MDKKTHLLEINLISAQNLKLPSANLRKLMNTYAVAWVDPSFKLRTRIDQIGGENPTWNDKFIFRVPSDYLTHDTSAVSIEIYAVRGYIKDLLIGTVRFLIGNSLPKLISSSSGSFVGGGGGGGGYNAPCFSALQIRRPSGRFQGILNVGANLINSTDFGALNGVWAIGYRDLMGENGDHIKKRHRRNQSSAGSENMSCGESGEYSDADSTCSSTSTASTSSSVLKDLTPNWFAGVNGGGRRKGGEMAGKKERSDGTGLFCGLGFQKIHLSPSDQNLQNITNTGLMKVINGQDLFDEK